MPVVDLRSDTVTRPTPAMRDAIARAHVGDDALGDDPTVQQLEQRIATILGKEAAVFFPSGIMANESALAVLCAPGTEVICEGTCHFVDWELGAPAAIAGVMMRGIHAPDGMLTADLVRGAIRPRSSRYQLQTAAITVENTHNAAGGRVLPLAVMRDIRALADEHDLPVHLDGARLWNACAATRVDAAEYAACADTVMVTLSKGLGCPVGSLLAGTAAHMERARIVRRRLGGTMRQAGILAAAGLYAIDQHRDRLDDDHRRAGMLARLAAHIDGITVIEPETNIVMMDVDKPGETAASIVAKLKQYDVLFVEFTSTRIRAVTHLDIDDNAVRQAAEALAHVMT